MLTNNKGRELVAGLPRDRVLTETDGPFAGNNGRPSAPRDVERTVRLLGQLWGVEAREADNQIATNMRMLLGTQMPSRSAEKPQSDR